MAFLNVTALSSPPTTVHVACFWALGTLYQVYLTTFASNEKSVLVQVLSNTDISTSGSFLTKMSKVFVSSEQTSFANTSIV